MSDIEVEGLAATLRAVDRIPRVVEQSGRRAGRDFGTAEVPRIRARAARVGKMQGLAARSVRPGPQGLLAGAGGGVPAAIFHGAEFGGRRRPTTQQFLPFRGQRGYWFWSQLRDDEGRLIETFSEVLDDVAEDWER